MARREADKAAAERAATEAAAERLRASLAPRRAPSGALGADSGSDGAPLHTPSRPAAGDHGAVPPASSPPAPQPQHPIHAVSAHLWSRQARAARLLVAMPLWP